MLETGHLITYLECKFVGDLFHVIVIKLAIYLAQHLGGLW